MTSCEEFFSRLRKLAVTLDKESNELKGILENSEISSYNENRACVLLRETLTEVKNCKVSKAYRINGEREVCIKLLKAKSYMQNLALKAVVGK